MFLHSRPTRSVSFFLWGHPLPPRIFIQGGGISLWVLRDSHQLGWRTRRGHGPVGSPGAALYLCWRLGPREMRGPREEAAGGGGGSSVPQGEGAQEEGRIGAVGRQGPWAGTRAWGGPAVLPLGCATLGKSLLLSG